MGINIWEGKKTEQLISAIGGLSSAITEDTISNLGPNYAELTFPVDKGQYCVYNNKLYMAKVDITTPEGWTSGHWDQVNISDELETYRNNIIEVSSAEPTENINNRLWIKKQGEVEYEVPTMKEFEEVKSAVDKIYYTGSVAASAGQTKYLNYEFLAGHKYKVTNNSSGITNIVSCDSSNSTVESFGQVGVNTTKEITVTLDAPKLKAYFRQDGTIIIVDISNGVPKLEGDVQSIGNRLTIAEGKVNNEIESILNEVVYKKTVTGTANATKYEDYEFISGHSYKVFNGSSAIVNVSSCDENNTAVESFGQVGPNAERVVTASENAVKLLLYYRGSGSVTIEDIDKRLPVTEKNALVGLEANNNEKTDKNSIDKLHFVLKDFIDTSINAADLGKIVNYAISGSAVLAPDANSGCLKIPVMYNSVYRIYIDYTLMGARYAFTKEDGTVIYCTATAKSEIQNIYREAKYLFIYYQGATVNFYSNHHVVVTIDTEIVPQSYVKPIDGGSVLAGLSKNQWRNKIWSAYGDSLTAISNGDELTLGWAKYVNKEYEMAGFHGRGIGGQSYAWGEHGGSVAFINTTTGRYNSRNDSYNYDNYSGNIPSGCAKVRGAFPSWIRITTMYPESIKDNIDLIFLFGGTNDTLSHLSDLQWIENDTTDPEWAASSFYSTYGGDYNINTVEGGLASTIMKMQAWMPNAIIAVGTPWNGIVSSTGSIEPGTVPRQYQVAKSVKDIATIFGCPIVDVFGTCGVNVLNSPTYITDGTHPYNDAGQKMLARGVIGGFKTIFPNL